MSYWQYESLIPERSKTKSMRARKYRRSNRDRGHQHPSVLSKLPAPLHLCKLSYGQAVEADVAPPRELTLRPSQISLLFLSSTFRRSPDSGRCTGRKVADIDRSTIVCIRSVRRCESATFAFHVGSEFNVKEDQRTTCRYQCTGLNV